MKFRIDGSKVICSRTNGAVDGDSFKDVIEFDIRVDVVPASVAEKLSREELQELNLFLADQQRMRSKSEHRVILEALPGLIDRVRGVLVSTTEIDGGLHKQLVQANQLLGSALANVRVMRGDRVTRVEDIGKQ